MKNETYLMVNGQKIELTAEQKKQLGIVEEKSCFDRVIDVRYYYISCEGEVYLKTDTQCGVDKSNYSVANYCTDKNLMCQRALHETLNRLLWRYSMTHDGDKIDWDSHGTIKYSIAYDTNLKRFVVPTWIHCKSTDIYFHSERIAKDAIEEIVKPFVKEHSDFVW